MEQFKLIPEVKIKLLSLIPKLIFQLIIDEFYEK